MAFVPIATIYAGTTPSVNTRGTNSEHRLRLAPALDLAKDLASRMSTETMFPHDGNCFSGIRGCSGGKFDAERASFPLLAGDKNRGAVGGADFLYDREPQPSSTGSPRARFIRAIKTLENMGQSTGRNSCAVVRDFDNGSPVF